MKPQDRIVFALDVPSLAEAQRFDVLRPYVGFFKVGLELFLAEGPEVLRALAPFPLVLDLKLHDIPETVERALDVVLRYPHVRYVTLHVQQRDTLERVHKKTQGTHLTPLVVTVLTSMTSFDCTSTGLYDASVQHHVDLRATFAYQLGLRGFVCTPPDLPTLRRALGQSTTLMTPGIRPAGAAPGDQKRMGTPAQALRDGADLLVIGRPIRDAPDPVAAVQAIVDELEGV
jgi:orotidine-5'-phosphate decarboxylase